MSEGKLVCHNCSKVFSRQDYYTYRYSSQRRFFCSEACCYGWKKETPFSDSCILILSNLAYGHKKRYIELVKSIEMSESQGARALRRLLKYKYIKKHIENQRRTYYSITSKGKKWIEGYINEQS